MPDDISMEKVCTIGVDGGQGIGMAFAGAHTYLSNFAAAQFNYKGLNYTSIEQGFSHQQALHCGAREEADQIMAITNP